MFFHASRTKRTTGGPIVTVSAAPSISHTPSATIASLSKLITFVEPSTRGVNGCRRIGASGLSSCPKRYSHHCISSSIPTGSPQSVSMTNPRARRPRANTALASTSSTTAPIAKGKSVNSRIISGCSVAMPT